MNSAVELQEAEVTMVRLGDIIVNPAYQVRTKVNPYYVNAYADCMRMGHEFPPLVLVDKTNELVCGEIRNAAYQKVFDPDWEVPVKYMRFKNEQAILLFATEDNSRHGHPLEPWDQKNMVQKLLGMKIDVKEISRVLGSPVSRVEKMAGETVIVIGDKPPFRESRVADLSKKKKAMAAQAMVDVNGERKPVKRGFGHLVDKTISEDAYEEIKDRQVGFQTQFLALQIIGRIDNKLLDKENESDMEALKVLYGRLTKLFG